MSALGSRVDPSVDLGTLVRERPAPASAVRPPRRRLRLVLALVALLACAALFADGLRGLVLGARPVRVLRPAPVERDSAATASAGTVATQAAGWVEPDPFLVHVAALADGIVREMLVQESDRVEAGQPVATLIDDDARIALAMAEGRLALARGELAAARAEHEAACEALGEAIELTAAREAAAAELAARRAEVALREAALVSGRARVRLAQDELVVQQELERSGAAGPRQAEIAAARVEEAQGELSRLQAEEALARAGLRAAEVEDERARRQDALRIEERRRVEAAAAKVAVAEGLVAEHSAGCDEARLRLERMVVRAPATGIVLERLAVPGTPLSGMDHTLATLYEPESIRVRVDVPQQDLARLFVGQEARIESDARPGRPYAGRVLRVVRQADLQKVTMQAHVRVLEPDELLRPQMLVQVRFLAPSAGEEPSGTSAGGAGRAVAIPARLVVDGRVWVLDPEHDRARARTVELGARQGELVVVTRGLDLSDKLLEPLDGEPLQEGSRVRAQEERP